MIILRKPINMGFFDTEVDTNFDTNQCAKLPF